MTQEEKAKAYDEAIEKLRDFYRDYDTVSCLIDVKEELANLFPELKESEDVDKKIREEIIATIHLYYGEPLEDEAKEMIAWIEKQGEQKPVEWSEKDENTIKVLMNIIRKSEIIDSIIYTDSLKEKLYDWLKSLKERIGWKPSDEQMRALHDLNLTGNISYAGQGQVLIELYNDLKKLTE